MKIYNILTIPFLLVSATWASGATNVQELLSGLNANERETIFSHQSQSVVKLSQVSDGTQRKIKAEVFALMETTCEQAMETYHQLEKMDEKISLGPLHPMSDFSYSKTEKILYFNTTIVPILNSDNAMTFEFPSHQGKYPFKLIAGKFTGSYGHLELRDVGAYHCFVHVQYYLELGRLVELLIPMIEEHAVKTVNDFIRWPVQEKNWTATEKNNQKIECNQLH